VSVNSLRKAFTLLELIIVVLIIGVVYTLVIVNFNDKKTNQRSINLSNLQAHMRGLKYEESVKFVCMDDCSQCEMIVDGNKTEQYDGILDKSVKMYRFDQNNALVATSSDTYFNKNGVREDVCFSYSIDKAGIGDQILVAYKNKVYDFGDFINGTKVYDSLANASDTKNQLIQEVQK